jgi:DNA-binding transcriptional MerR regulator
VTGYFRGSVALAEYRLDQLAALSGVSVRNIRAYRERGLLDAPRREGRWAFYSDRHLAQLRAVNELLRKGYTSAHIAEFLDGTRQGRDLADVLGLQRAVFGPPRRAAAAVDPDGDEARRLLQYGLAEVIDGELVLVNPNIAEILGRITEQLPYIEAILRVSDGIAGLLDELATAVADALGQSPVDDYRAMARYLVADQLEDALRRRLESESGDPTLGGQADAEND